MMRIRPIIAIARRLSEFAAKKRGWILLGITTLLLVPLSSVPNDLFAADESAFRVTGEVPAALESTLVLQL